MCSQAKLEANRRNAQLSTGPRTEAGKAIASRNAITHGLTAAVPLIPGEDPAAYQAHCDRFRDYLKPQTPIEEAQFQALATVAWKIKRLPALDAALYQQLHLRHARQLQEAESTEPTQTDELHPCPSLLPPDATTEQLIIQDLCRGERNSSFMRLHRYGMSLDRTFNRLLKQLEHKDRADAPAQKAPPHAGGPCSDPIGKPNFAAPTAAAAPAAPPKAPVPQPQLTLPVLPSVFSQQKEPKKPLSKAQKAQAALANACLSTLHQTGAMAAMGF